MFGKIVAVAVQIVPTVIPIEADVLGNILPEIQANIKTKNLDFDPLNVEVKTVVFLDHLVGTLVIVGYVYSQKNIANLGSLVVESTVLEIDNVVLVVNALIL